MILAAGHGTRMRELTHERPKALVQLGGRPLLAHCLGSLAAAGLDHCVINLGRHGQQVRAFLADGAGPDVSVTFSDEGDDPLETGGGILKALPLLAGGPFWVANADVYSQFQFREPVLPAGTLAHLILVPNPEHNPDGDFCLIDGRVAAAGADRLTYSGISILSPQLFAGTSPGRFPLAPLLDSAIAAGMVSGELFTGVWIDVGTPERLAEAEAILAGEVSGYTSR